MRYLFGGLVAAWGLCALSTSLRAEDQPEPGLFAMLDGNKDGQISRDEVPEEKQRLFDRLLREADKDSNSQINADELSAGLASVRAEQPQPEAKPEAAAENINGGPLSPAALLARFDADGDGLLTKNEIPEQAAMLKKVLKKSDTNNDEKVSQEELEALGKKFDKLTQGFSRPESARRDRELLAQGPPEGGRPDGPPGPPRGEGRGPQGPDPEEVFKRMDTNSDGSVSKEEFVEHHKQMMERFRNFRPGGPEGDRPRREGRPGRPEGEGRPDGPPRGEGRRGPPEGGEGERGPRDRGPREGGPRDRGPREGGEGGRPDGPPRGEGRGPGGRGPGGNPEEFFSKLDKNSDGKLTADEAPEEGKERFTRMLERQDKDDDKAISKEEFMAGARQRAERFREGRGGPEGRRRPGGPDGRPDGPPPGGPEGGPPEGGPPGGGPPGDRPARPEPEDEVNNEGRPEFGRPWVRAWLVQARGPRDGDRPAAPPEARGPRDGDRPAGPPEGRGGEGRRPQWHPERGGPQGPGREGWGRPEGRGPEGRGPEGHRRPEGRGPEARGPEGRGPEGRGARARGPMGRPQGGPSTLGPIAIFRLLNSDGDDKISGDELAAAAMKLSSLDKDKDGAVSIREMVTLGGRVPGGEMRRPGPPGPPPHAGRGGDGPRHEARRGPDGPPSFHRHAGPGGPGPRHMAGRGGEGRGPQGRPPFHGHAARSEHGSRHHSGRGPQGPPHAGPRHAGPPHAGRGPRSMGELAGREHWDRIASKSAGHSHAKRGDGPKGNAHGDCPHCKRPMPGHGKHGSKGAHAGKGKGPKHGAHHSVKGHGKKGHGKHHAHGKKHDHKKGHGKCPMCGRAGKGKSGDAHRGPKHGGKHKHPSMKHGHGKKSAHGKHAHGKKSAHGKKGHGKSHAHGKKGGSKKGDGKCPHCGKGGKGKPGDAHRGPKHGGHKHAGARHGRGKGPGPGMHRPDGKGPGHIAGRPAWGRPHASGRPAWGGPPQGVRGPMAGRGPGRPPMAGRGPGGPPQRGWGGPGRGSWGGPAVRGSGVAGDVRIAWDGDDVASGRGGMPQFDPAKMIERMTAALDGNKDGKVSFEEFTASHKKRFEELDSNKDGSIDEAERKQAAEKMQERIKKAGEKFRGGRGKGGPKPDGPRKPKAPEKPEAPKADAGDPPPPQV